MNLGKCRGCGAEIYWIKTAAGKNMPVDARHVIWSESDGKITLVTENGVVITNPHVGNEGYAPHWATCSQAQRFKK